MEQTDFARIESNYGRKARVFLKDDNSNLRVGDNFFFGEYPHNYVTTYQGNILEILFKNGFLKETGRSFTSYADYKFVRDIHGKERKSYKSFDSDLFAYSTYPL